MSRSSLQWSISNDMSPSSSKWIRAFVFDPPSPTLFDPNRGQKSPRFILDFATVFLQKGGSALFNLYVFWNYGCRNRCWHVKLDNRRGEEWSHSHSHGFRWKSSHPLLYILHERRHRVWRRGKEEADNESYKHDLSCEETHGPTVRRSFCEGGGGGDAVPCGE